MTRTRGRFDRSGPIQVGGCWGAGGRGGSAQDNTPPQPRVAVGRRGGGGDVPRGDFGINLAALPPSGPRDWEKRGGRELLPPTVAGDPSCPPEGSGASTEGDYLGALPKRRWGAGVAGKNQVGAFIRTRAMSSLNLEQKKTNPPSTAGPGGTRRDSRFLVTLFRKARGEGGGTQRNMGGGGDLLCRQPNRGRPQVQVREKFFAGPRGGVWGRFWGPVPPGGQATVGGGDNPDQPPRPWARKKSRWGKRLAEGRKKYTTTPSGRGKG